MIIKNPVTGADINVPNELINPRYENMGLAFSLICDNDLAELGDEVMDAPGVWFLDHTGN